MKSELIHGCCRHSGGDCERFATGGEKLRQFGAIMTQLGSMALSEKGCFEISLTEMTLEWSYSAEAGINTSLRYVFPESGSSDDKIAVR